MKATSLLQLLQSLLLHVSTVKCLQNICIAVVVAAQSQLLSPKVNNLPWIYDGALSLIIS